MRHKHWDLPRVTVVFVAEALAQELLFGARTDPEGREGHEERAREQQQVAGRDTRADEVDRESGVDGVAHERERTIPHDLMSGVDLEHQVVVTTERRDGPQRHANAADAEADAD